MDINGLSILQASTRSAKAKQKAWQSRSSAFCAVASGDFLMEWLQVGGHRAVCLVARGRTDLQWDKAAGTVTETWCRFFVLMEWLQVGGHWALCLVAWSSDVTTASLHECYPPSIYVNWHLHQCWKMHYQALKYAQNKTSDIVGPFSMHSIGTWCCNLINTCQYVVI